MLLRAMIAFCLKRPLSNALTMLPIREQDGRGMSPAPDKRTRVLSRAQCSVIDHGPAQMEHI